MVLYGATSNFLIAACLSQFAVTDRSKRRLTIVCDVRDLEPFATVALIGLKLDPKLARARGEGDGPLVRLARLVRGDGGGKGCEEEELHFRKTWIIIIIIIRM